jgi:hypothetical protein
MLSTPPQILTGFRELPGSCAVGSTSGARIVKGILPSVLNQPENKPGLTPALTV